MRSSQNAFRCGLLANAVGAADYRFQSTNLVVNSDQRNIDLVGQLVRLGQRFLSSLPLTSKGHCDDPPTLQTRDVDGAAPLRLRDRPSDVLGRAGVRWDRLEERGGK